MTLWHSVLIHFQMRMKSKACVVFTRIMSPLKKGKTIHGQRRLLSRWKMKTFFFFRIAFRGTSWTKSNLFPTAILRTRVELWSAWALWWHPCSSWPPLTASRLTICPGTSQLTSTTDRAEVRWPRGTLHHLALYSKRLICIYIPPRYITDHRIPILVLCNASMKNGVPDNSVAPVSFSLYDSQKS